MAGKSIICVYLALLVVVFTRTCIAGDVQLSNVVITTALDTITYTTTATISITLEVLLVQSTSEGGVAVTGIGAYFKNEGGSVNSEADMIQNDGSATAAADVTYIGDVVMPIIVKGVNCSEFLYLCFKVQYAAGSDSDPSNDDFCRLLGTEAGNAGAIICPAVSLDSVTITAPVTPTYMQDVETTITFTAGLTQADEGVAVTGINIYFANDDKSTSTTAVSATDATGGRSDMAITGASAAAELDSSCTDYTQLCFELLVSIDEDTDGIDNNIQCLAVSSDKKTCDISHRTTTIGAVKDVGVIMELNMLLFIGGLLSALPTITN